MDNNYYSNNTINFINGQNNISLNRTKTPLSKNNRIDYYSNWDLNQNLEEQNINFVNKNELFSKTISKNFDNFIFRDDEENKNLGNNILNLNINLRNSVDLSNKNKKKNFIKIQNSEKKEKSVKSEKKIKEIIINKKIDHSICNSNDVINNNLNHSQIKLRTLLNERKPIQVNLLNTYDKLKKENSYEKDFDMKKITKNGIDKNQDKNKNINKIEIIEINNNKIENNIIRNISGNNFEKRINKCQTINSFHNNFNINQNLQKKFQQANNEENIININNSFENSNHTNKLIDIENPNISKTYKSKKNKDKENSFYMNKNKFATRTMKKIYIKNKKNIEDIINNNKSTIEKEKDKKFKEINKVKKLKKYVIISNRENPLSKSNVEHFQILPNREEKNSKDKKTFHRNFFFSKGKRNIIERKENSEKKKNPHESFFRKKEKKINKRNVFSENQNISEKHILFNSTLDMNFDETFKNSIRNKYKREKNLHKK